MLNREFEKDAQSVLLEKRVGAVAFCSLAEGILTDKYFHGVPADSRAAGPSVFLSRETAQGAYVEAARKLNEIAQERGQKLSQMALAWALNNPDVYKRQRPGSVSLRIFPCETSGENIE